jgi:hypothetical protein
VASRGDSANRRARLASNAADGRGREFDDEVRPIEGEVRGINGELEKVAGALTTATR